jgi:ubiquinone/menaquinone biosynthesis C-methylase UbiE
MITGMLLRFAMALALPIGLLHAQPSAAQLDKLYSQMDDAMGVRSGAIIGDIGTGFAIDHSLLIAEKLEPGGKLFCVDVKQSVISKIKDQADARHITNVEAVLGADDDPKLPPLTFDAILVSNTYHEFTQPSAMLKHLCEALKPGGTLVVVENCSIAHRSDSRPEQTKRHDIAPDILERELSAASLVVKERIDPILVESADRFRYLFKAEKSK